MSFLQQLLLVNIVVQLALFLLSIKNLSVKKYYRKTINWIFPIGAYVWDDALPISVFWTISSILLFFLNDLKSTLILVLIFFLFRFLGEMFYWLLQQFHSDNFRPNDFGLKNLPNQNIYIIYQVWNMCQTVLVAFFLYLVISKF